MRPGEQTAPTLHPQHCTIYKAFFSHHTQGAPRVTDPTILGRKRGVSLLKADQADIGAGGSCF